MYVSSFQLNVWFYLLSLLAVISADQQQNEWHFRILSYHLMMACGDSGHYFGNFYGASCQAFTQRIQMQDTVETVLMKRSQEEITTVNDQRSVFKLGF